MKNLTRPVVSRVHGPLPKTTQDKPWIKDIKTQKRPVRKYRGKIPRKS